MDTTIEAQLLRYRQLRAVQKELHHRLMSLLPRIALPECGTTLGVYKDDTLILGSENEMAVLMDYCIYNYRWDGHNVIERYVDQTPVESGSDTKIILDAMLEARYSIFMVDEVAKGVGVKTRDMLRGDGGFIIDVALSETVMKGFVLACRIISPGDCRFSMTTGAGLPADRSIIERIIKEIPARFGKTSDKIVRTSSERPAEFSASIIRIFLEGNASSRMTHEDHAGEGITRGESRIGRNEPCPCGSGKKYKKCCGKGT